MIEKIRKKISNYVSPEDRFIHEFDQVNADETSPLKQQEIAKHARLARLRDDSNSEESPTDEEWW